MNAPSNTIPLRRDKSPVPIGPTHFWPCNNREVISIPVKTNYLPAPDFLGKQRLFWRQNARGLTIHEPAPSPLLEKLLRTPETTEPHSVGFFPLKGCKREFYPSREWILRTRSVQPLSFAALKHVMERHVSGARISFGPHNAFWAKMGTEKEHLWIEMRCNALHWHLFEHELDSMERLEKAMENPASKEANLFRYFPEGTVFAVPIPTPTA